MTVLINKMPMSLDDPGALPPELARPRLRQPGGRGRVTLKLPTASDKATWKERKARARQLATEAAAISEEVKRIGQACHQCSVVEDSPDADDCPFIKLCPGNRRRQIRAKTAKCHVGRWVVNLG